MAIDSLCPAPITAKSVESSMQCQQRIRSVAANQRWRGPDRQQKIWLDSGFCVLQFVIMLWANNSFRPVRAAVAMDALVTCELSIVSTGTPVVMSGLKKDRSSAVRGSKVSFFLFPSVFCIWFYHNNNWRARSVRSQ